MPTTTGKITQILVAPEACCVSIDQTSGPNKTMLLWSYTSQEDNATNRLTHGAYLSIARDALIADKTVSINHEENSALTDSISIRQ